MNITRPGGRNTVIFDWYLWSGATINPIVNEYLQRLYNHFITKVTNIHPDEKYRIMSHVAESRAWALGTVNMETSEIPNTIDLQIARNDIWSDILWKEPRECKSPVYSRHPASPFLAHRWHSGEFRMAIMEQRKFWKRIKKELGCPSTGDLPE